jgi:hypothetical protein
MEEHSLMGVLLVQVLDVPALLTSQDLVHWGVLVVEAQVLVMTGLMKSELKLKTVPYS